MKKIDHCAVYFRRGRRDLLHPSTFEQPIETKDLCLAANQVVVCSIHTHQRDREAHVPQNSRLSHLHRYLSATHRFEPSDMICTVLESRSRPVAVGILANFLHGMNLGRLRCPAILCKIEEHALLRAVVRSGNLRDIALFELALGRRLRRGEVGLVKMEHLNLDTKC